ncbi:MAG: OmpH family outer membrane protein [Altibacter sp.]|uniref:OmpH family outer membrane protein n=1 Tax=Altibacter sp. TaxID=2024823 RepID=UPI001D74B61E|nr:OmpH family outer membrane protein [Altibacter sp.]MBZ0326845.1 OmpH family outer membrane protein [Altibacter sp.]
MRILAILFLFISFSAFSQTKVGTVDVDFILSKMPEIPSVQKQVEDYGKELDADFKKNLEAYDALVKAYTEGEAGLTIAQKKTKQEEIIAAENDLNKIQQNGSKLMNIKRDELLRPLYQKIGVSLEKIAKAEGYTQVLQLDNSVVYADNTYDLTLTILKDLGITIEEETKQ